MFSAIPAKLNQEFESAGFSVQKIPSRQLVGPEWEKEVVQAYSLRKIAGYLILASYFLQPFPSPYQILFDESIWEEHS